MAPDHPPAAASGDTAPIGRTVIVSGRRTSIRMEPVMWTSLTEICERETLSVSEICGLVDGCRGEYGLTAALRLFIVSYFRELVWQGGMARPACAPERSAALAGAMAVFGPPPAGPAG